MAADSITGKIAAKEEHLKRLLASYGKVAIAYSGGVDSTYLADVAHEVLGENAHMLLADSPVVPRDELRTALAIAHARKWRLAILTPRQFDDKHFLRNDSHRCYYCKNELFRQMKAYATTHAIRIIAHGENADDAADTSRIGQRAAHEQHAAAPLQETGLTKDDIRQLSARRRLPTAGKASFACLATRIPKGHPITTDALATIEQAEAILRQFGFHQYRARHHGDLCRIELDPADFPKVMQTDTRLKLIDALRTLGYRYIALDLIGYRLSGEQT